MSLTYSSGFKEDLISALEWALENFGEKTRTRYLKLIEVSLNSITKDPLLLHSREFEKTVRIYHLKHRKKAARVDGIAVNNPKHMIVYRIEDGEIEILRLLHERMDIISQLGESE